MIPLWLRLSPASARFLRFLVVGVANTIVGNALYAAIYLLTALGPQTSLLLAFWLGVLWNYFATARFVFRTRGFARLPAYIACYLAVYAVNAKAPALAVAAGWPPLLTQIALTPAAAILSFILVSFALTHSSPRQANNS